jgi:hypothetical protein
VRQGDGGIGVPRDFKSHGTLYSDLKSRGTLNLHSKSCHLPLSLLQGGKLNFQFRELCACQKRVYNVGPVILNLFPPSKGEGKNIDFPPRGGIKF